MKPCDFYLCYLKALSKPELNLVHAYWWFGDTLDEYKYQKNNVSFSGGNIAIPNLFSNIGKYVYIASKFLSCSVCGDKFKASSRSQLQKLLDKKPEKCSSCLKGEINEVATEMLDRLEACLPDFNFPIVENNISFNYLDALFTFIILSEDFDYATGRISHPDDLNFTGSHAHDMQIFSDLLSKNIIYEIDENLFTKNSFYEQDVKYLRKSYSNLNRENRDKYDDINSKIPKPGYYIAKPDQFEGYSILMYFLYEDILNKEVSLDDIKLLEELVNKTLLHKAYQLIPIVEADFRITIERSLRLETILLYGVKHFLLNQVFNVFYFQGRQTAADIHSKLSIYRKVHEKIYIENVEKRMNKLENNILEKRYIKYLPSNMIDSKVEIFSSRYFLGDVMSWANLSGNEVVKRWANAHGNND